MQELVTITFYVRLTDEKIVESSLRFFNEWKSEEEYPPAKHFGVAVDLYIPLMSVDDVWWKIEANELRYVEVNAHFSRPTPGAHVQAMVTTGIADLLETHENFLRFSTPNMSGTMGYNVAEILVLQPI